MPRYFFHVYDDTDVPDLIGTEYPDVYVAQAEAVRTAGEIMRDLGRKFWAGDEWRLEMTDAEGKVLFVVRFSAKEAS